MQIRSRKVGAKNDSWALVLGAGEGTRLRTLTTTPAGIAVPKQFCALHRGESLLDETILRARRVVPHRRVCMIVAAHHRQWWRPSVALLEPGNVIVQPRNRGTAIGMVLPLLHILHRDPGARVLILPSDHHVQNEAALQHALQAGLQAIDEDAMGVALLGVDPEGADEELGYIVPGPSCGAGFRHVARFVEKPSASTAQSLIAEGALWNVFILIARARALLDLIDRYCPGIVAELRHALVQAPDGASAVGTLAPIYERLPELDFSRHVAQRAASSLRVIRAAQCGWSDLGTPKRVAEVLNRPASVRGTPALGSGPPCLSLAEQFARSVAAPMSLSA